jgi:hypothetical protein
VLDLYPVGTPLEQGVQATPDGAGEAQDAEMTVAWSPGAPEHVAAIHGETVDGVPCSLLAPICLNWQGNFRHSREIWSSYSVLHGVHVHASEELQFDAATVELHGLKEWATLSTHGLRGALDGSHEVERITVEVPGAELSITVEPSFPLSEGERQRVRVANVSFQFDQPQTLPAFRKEYVGPLQDLLLLATREPTPVGSVVADLAQPPPEALVPPFPAGKTLVRSRPAVQIVERSRMSWPVPSNRHHHRMLFSLAALGDEPDQFIGRWYERRHAIGSAGNFFFGTLDEPHWDLNDRLFKPMNFAEAYHRSCLDAPPLHDDVHSALTSRMLSAVDTDEQREVYRDRLRYANSQTQRQRTEALVVRAAEAVPELQLLEPTLSRSLAHTRNYLTHWETKTQYVLEDPGEYLLAVAQLMLVLQVNLMRDLELPDEVIRQGVLASYEGQRTVPRTA